MCGGAWGRATSSAGEHVIASDAFVGTGTCPVGPSWARVAFNVPHRWSTMGQSGSWSGEPCTAGAGAGCPAAMAAGDAISIGSGIVIKGRIIPDRHTKSAHTSNAPDHVRSDNGKRRTMRAMLSQAPHPTHPPHAEPRLAT